MTLIKKAITKAEMLGLLERGEVLLPPLSLVIRPETGWIPLPPLPPRGRRVNRFAQSGLSRDLAEAAVRERGADVVLAAGWDGTSQDFAVACETNSTPAALEAVVLRVREMSRPPDFRPLVFVPYLGDEQLRWLERQGVSGLDLCGNGVVLAPGKLLVCLTGKPNLYPQSFPIKNIFRGVSSLVARVFLLRPQYGTVGEILEEIRRREGAVALSTVSKVVTRLEEELIVGRASGAIRLLQADKLLGRLAEKYRPPEITRRFVGKTNVGPEALLMPQLGWAREKRASLVMTGVASARAYAGTAREPTVSFYCSDVAGLLERLGSDVRETNLFPDLELLETGDPSLYFDRRVIGGCPWASPLQTYLELAAGGKREQETAEDVKKVIWRGLEGGAESPVSFKGESMEPISVTERLKEEFWTGFCKVWPPEQGVLLPREGSGNNAKIKIRQPDSPFSRKDCWLEAQINFPERWIQVELILDNEGTKVFTCLHQKQVEIERAVGIDPTLNEEFIWSPLKEGRRRVWIGVRRNEMNLNDRSQWLQRQEWLRNRLERFGQVFVPRLQAYWADA